MKHLTKIYIDFDGVLTSYDRTDYINNKWKEQPNILCKPPVIKEIPKDWIILTKTSTPKESHLKKEWASHYFPNNQIITLSPYESKTEYAKGNILLDDYNKNLDEWTQAGGYSIKILNNVNSFRDDLLCINQPHTFSYEIVMQDDNTPAVVFHSSTASYDRYSKLFLKEE